MKLAMNERDLDIKLKANVAYDAAIRLYDRQLIPYITSFDKIIFEFGDKKEVALNLTMKYFDGMLLYDAEKFQTQLSS